MREGGTTKTGMAIHAGNVFPDVPHGAIDIFRYIKGLDDWAECASNAVPGKTDGGADYLGLSDADMLKCQYALDENLRKPDRVRVLEERVKNNAS